MQLSHKTPCEVLGYKEGDKFIARNCFFFPDGAIMELYNDDGSELPLFTGEECTLNNGPDGIGGAFESINGLVKVQDEN